MMDFPGKPLKKKLKSVRWFVLIATEYALITGLKPLKTCYNILYGTVNSNP